MLDLRALNWRSRLGRWTIPIRLVLGGLGTAALWLFWAAGIEPRLLDETRVDARIPGLPPDWEGARIAALGDFQLGMWWANVGTVRHAIDRVLKLQPAAVVLLGDFLYHPSPHSKEAIDCVKTLLDPLAGSGIPTYAVLGNHDYGLDDNDALPPQELAEDVRHALEELGVTVLEDTVVELACPRASAGQEAEPLVLAGLNSYKADSSQPLEAIAAVLEGRPRIVVMHNPHSFRSLPRGSAPFALAGHTHGAQIRIPFLPGRSWLARREEMPPHASGWAAPDFGQPGNHLYVNRGIGFSRFPLRFNARPELTLFRLVRD